MPSLDFDCKCDECGADLDANVRIDNKRSIIYVDVKPCEDCMEKKYNAGYDEGKEANEQ